MPATRTETDTLGAVEVPSERYWGAQTQRSIGNFPIGGERMPSALIRAFAIQKQAAARANRRLGELDPAIADAIETAAAAIARGELDEEFPLECGDAWPWAETTCLEKTKLVWSCDGARKWADRFPM